MWFIQPTVTLVSFTLFFQIKYDDGTSQEKQVP